MDTYNPSSYHARIYWITDPGRRLAAYLDYCGSHPDLSPDLAFADVSVPPEQYDEDRAQPPEGPEEQSLEDAGYDGMGGTPWDAGFEDPAIDDEIEEE